MMTERDDYEVVFSMHSDPKLYNEDQQDNLVVIMN
jgi:hypothetical protein